MIEKISSRLTNTYTPNWDSDQPSFQGIGELVLQGIQACERHPMLNVAALDLSTAIIPRSVIETKESNAYAGMEAFRRESSGLIVNCLIPSFIVMGVAKLLQKPTMKGFGKSDLSNVWANEESIKIFGEYMKKADGKGKFKKALRMFLDDLSGVDGNEIKTFKDFKLDDNIIGKLNKASSVKATAKEQKQLIKEAYTAIVEQTHISENIKLKEGFLSKNLKGFLEDFVKLNQAMKKEGVSSNKQIDAYLERAIKLVKRKSFAGLGIIIPLAISMQPINRWITSKRSGVKGAPIYKDFGSKDNQTEMTKKEKKNLLKQKFISVGSMIGTMLLSMGKFPGKEAFQFKGLFPTMDQARLISTATFSSRMMASEDKNELREATIRDIATFSSLYFLGDYAAKAVATLIEKIKPNVKLLNTLKEMPKDANVFQKIKHWVKDVSLKSSEEVIGKTARNLRSVCQIGNFAFSLGVLGVFIPLYNRTQTNRKREIELKQMAASLNSTSGFLKDQINNGAPTFKSFFSLQ